MPNHHHHDNRGVGRIASRARLPADENGGTASRIIDLTNSDGAGRDHGCIVAMHVTPGFGPGQPYHTEKLRIPPPGARYELRCRDCPNEVTLVANPPCVHSAYIVTHSASCPWLAEALAGAR